MKPRKRKSMKLIAFWRYDSFPFVLGGEVTEMRPDGFVETVEYGPGHYFPPIKMLPLKAGRELLEKLKTVRARHAEALKSFSNAWLAEAADAFGESVRPGAKP